MKICLYTISDFSKHAIDCIDLLISSINSKNNNQSYDFYILTNNSNHKNNKYKTIIDSSINTNYIGYLKYSYSIPQGYDYYIYLDSDILFFDSLTSLICDNKDFSIVRENCIIDSNKEWFYFEHVPTHEQTLLKNSQALNAGSFAFSSDHKEKIFSIYDTYKKYFTMNILSNAKLEQSIYNFVLNKQSNYTLDNCYDITDTTLLFASKKQPSNDKKLYHFCGYTNEMTTKYISMRNFMTKLNLLDKKY